MKSSLLFVTLLATILGCGTEPTSNVKAGPGDSVPALDGADHYKLTQSGDLYRNMTPSDSQFGCKVAYNVKWFEIDSRGAVYALLDNKKVLRIKGLTRWVCSLVSNTEVAYNVEFVSVIKKPAEVQALTLLSNGNVLMFDRYGSKLGRELDRIKEIKHNRCFSQTGSSFSSYLGFALTKGGSILKLKSDGSYKADNGDFSSIKDFISQRNVCQ